MPYINFSEDDLYRANNADLVSYLGGYGGRVKKVGSTYQYIYTDGSGTHDSVTIHGGKWYDHKNQRGGYAVKFLQEFLGFSFQDSVIELLGGHCSAQTAKSISREVTAPIVKQASSTFLTTFMIDSPRSIRTVSYVPYMHRPQLPIGLLLSLPPCRGISSNLTDNSLTYRTYQVNMECRFLYIMTSPKNRKRAVDAGRCKPEFTSARVM